MIFCVCTGENQTITLPLLKQNQYVYIRNYKDLGTTTIQSSASNVCLNGTNTPVESFNLETTSSVIGLYCNGETWFQIS